jgi:hypothetical protein
LKSYYEEASMATPQEDKALEEWILSLSQEQLEALRKLVQDTQEQSYYEVKQPGGLQEEI